jgi:rhodanese-related sulfurtransferase
MVDEIVRKEKDVPDALEATRVTAEEVMTRMERGEPIVFVDARREEAWRSSAETLPGAVRLSPDGVARDDTLPVIPIGRSVVTYCTCPHEASSVRVARLLARRGYADVHPLHGGLEAWRRAGGKLVPK